MLAVTSPSGMAVNAWSLDGNAGTVIGTNFIGTTDNKPLKFRVNNGLACNIQSDGQTFLGLASGVGVYYNTGNNNTGFGGSVLTSNTTGSSNTGIGLFALANNTTGSNNVAKGMLHWY